MCNIHTILMHIWFTISSVFIPLAGSSGGLDGGEIAGIVVPLVLLVACVTLIAVIAVLVWKKRSGKYREYSVSTMCWIVA